MHRRLVAAVLLACAAFAAACGLLPIAAHPECEELATEYGPGVRNVAAFETTVGAVRDDPIFGPPLAHQTLRDDARGVLCYYDGDLPMPATEGGGPSTRAAVFHDGGGWGVLISGDAADIPLRAPGE